MDNRNRRDRGPQGQQVVIEKQYDERVLAVDRVARVVKGGRRFRFRSLVIVGDKKGKVGMGIAKGADVTTATTKATEVAKKNMITVPLYKGTIPHEVTGKVGGAKVMMLPAAPGTGLIAGASVRAVLEAVGVNNIISKSFGSSNKINACYAVLEALKTLQPKKDWVTTKNEVKTTKANVTTEKVKEAKKAEAAPKATKTPAKKGTK